MESTKQIQSLFFEMQDQKINSGSQTRKRYKKPEFLTEQLERGNFINLISWVSTMQWFSPDCKTAIFWNIFQFPRHTLSKFIHLQDTNLCFAFSHLKMKNIDQYTYILLNHLIWAYLFSVNTLPHPFPPSTQGNLVHHSSATVLRQPFLEVLLHNVKEAWKHTARLSLSF